MESCVIIILTINKSNVNVLKRNKKGTNPLAYIVIFYVATAYHRYICPM